MKLFIWKLRYVIYMWKVSRMPIKLCYQSSEAAIENNPDDIFEDGPIYYAEQEMMCWSD